MLLRLKSWHLLFIALLAACAVTLASTSAFAAEPGESDFQPEIVNGGGQAQSQDTFGEARSPGGTLVTIWRGWNDNHVWISVNNGPVQAIAYDFDTDTGVAPRILYSNGYFYAFHTGTDGNIYWSRVQDGGGGYVSNPANWTNWQTPATRNTTNQSVSVASSDAGILMAYRGSGSDTRLFSTWLPLGSTNWGPAQAMNTAAGNTINSINAPTVTYDPATRFFAAVWAGINDQQTWTGSQPLGGNNWGNVFSLEGPTTSHSPSIAGLSDGSYLISVVSNSDQRIQNMYVNPGGATNGWMPESTGYQTYLAVFTYAYATHVIMLLTDVRNNAVWWKTAYSR